jgi:hypothetical protein
MCNFPIPRFYSTTKPTWSGMDDAALLKPGAHASTQDDVTPDHYRSWTSLDEIPLQQWSLDRLARTGSNPEYVHEEIASIILDVSCRLERQIHLLQVLQQRIQELRQNPKIKALNNNNNSRNSSSFSTVTNNAKQRRPYWWSYQQERQLQDEFDAALTSLKNLHRLHQDTLKQSMQQYQQWTATQKHPTELSSWKAMTKTFQEIQARHALTVETMAELVIGVLHPLHHSPSITTDMEAFLQARLIIQLLCDHLAQLGKQHQQQLVGKVPLNTTGAVTQDHSVKSIVEAAVYEAGHLCEAHFLTRPQVEFVQAVRDTDGIVVQSTSDDDLQATFIRPWLQYTLVELLKNSMAATIEHPNPKCIGQLSCGTTADDDEESAMTRGHCPLFIHIHETNNHVAIQILDQAGGLAHTDKTVDDLFEFAQCSKKWDRLDDQQTYAMVRSPIRGLGVGLSMSRMQMRHFGGGDVVLEDRQAAGALQVAAADQHGNVQWFPIESGMTCNVLLSKYHA